MHWRTFGRLTAEHDAFVGVSLAGMAARLGLIRRRLDGIGDALHPEGLICFAKWRSGVDFLVVMGGIEPPTYGL
jgi:hypothetical protein